MVLIVELLEPLLLVLFVVTAATLEEEESEVDVGVSSTFVFERTVAPPAVVGSVVVGEPSFVGVVIGAAVVVNGFLIMKMKRKFY